MGVINLANKYGAERLDGARQHGLELGIRSYRGVRNLLESGLDQSPPAPEPDGIADGHENVRGQNYYQ